MSWILLPLVVVVAVLVLLQAARRSRRDLEVLQLVGWPPRLSALLAAALVLVPVGLAAVVGAVRGCSPLC